MQEDANAGRHEPGPQIVPPQDNIGSLLPQAFQTGKLLSIFDTYKLSTGYQSDVLSKNVFE